MFDSGISAKKMVEDLKNEVDIAYPISNSTYILWLNGLEQLLYTEFIQEQREIIINKPENYVIDIGLFDISDDENAVRFEDIYTVYADDTQLIKSSLTSGVIFPNTFYKTENNAGLNLSFEPEKIKIIYFVKPALKTVDENDSINDGNVMVPVEFIDLVKAKLRGEAYKIANEDTIASKWINDYNVLLENFKVWITGKSSKFGM